MRTNSTSQFIDDSDEPIGESLLNPIGWLAALILLAVTATAQISDMKDNSAEWAQSSALEQAQSQEQQAERRERAAQAMCSSDYGPQVIAVWVDDKTVQCVNPRGRALSTSVFEVAHAPH